jgi:hypothetical protein
MRRSTMIALAAGVVVLAVAVWFTRPVGDGVPLDPRGTDPTGTAALMRTIDRLGADVTITGEVPARTDVVLVVLADRLGDDRRQEVRLLVERGARLVLFDPRSDLNPVAAGPVMFTDLFGPLSQPALCDLFRGVADRVASARWTPLTADADTTAECFPIEDGFGVIVQQVGQGEVVVTSAVDALINREIATGDHASFGVALLAPEANEDVVVLWDAVIGGGDQALLDLVPDGPRRAFWVAMLGVVLYVLYRARRLGQPVAERLPVRVPASELALSIGDLLARHGHRDAAAARLRADLRSEVAAALHLPVDTPPDVLVELVAQRAGDDLDPAGIRLALLDGPVPDDDALVRITGALSRVRTRMHAGSPAAHR